MGWNQASLMISDDKLSKSYENLQLFTGFLRSIQVYIDFNWKKQKIAVPEKKVLNNPTPKLDHFHHFAWEFSWQAQNYEIFGSTPLNGHP